MMSQSNQPIDQAILELLQQKAEEQTVRMTKVIELVVDGLNGRMDQLDSSLEGFEQRLAMITVAYAEIASMITALVAKVGSGSPEEVEEFHKLVSEQRKQMLDLLRQEAEKPFTPHESMESDPSTT